MFLAGNKTEKLGRGKLGGEKLGSDPYFL